MAEGEQTCSRNVYVTRRKHKENTSSAFVCEGKRKAVKTPQASVSRQGEPVTRSHTGVAAEERTQADSQRGGCAARPSVATVGEEDGCSGSARASHLTEI